ncbi:MAG: phage major capsid protein [Bacteroidales bacterium]|jgi:HK97 family phage major capsid protein|nr:phage major capsid protein [Bacteroidales bacterium]
MDLERLHEEYRRACEAARDETASPETRKAAADDMLDRRHALDAALIEAQQVRDDERRQEQVEAARDRAARLVAGLAPVQVSPFPVDDVRAYGQSKKHGETLSFTIPIVGHVAPGLARQFAAPQAADWTTSDTTTYSSYTVPQRWASELYMFQIAQSGVLAAGPTILTTANGNQINYPKLTTDMSSAVGTEGSAATETNPVFGTTPLNSYRVDGWTPLADELFRDSGVDIEAVLRELALRSLAATAAPYYGNADTGTGNSYPAAITVGTTLGKTAAAVDSVTLDELKELMYSVLPAYRAVGRFVGNSDVTLEVALAKDGDGRYMMQPSASAAEPDRVFGKPWYEDAYFDASGSANKCVVFGDVHAAYIVRQIGGIQVDLSRDFAFTSFETTARWAMWHDAATIDTLAVKHLAFA